MIKLQWFTVNGGVLLVALVVRAVESGVQAATQSLAAASFFATAALYSLVFVSCRLNLRGRPRALPGKRSGKGNAVPGLSSLLWHPLGSCVERFIHHHLHHNLHGMPGAGDVPPAASLVLGQAEFKASSGVAWWFAGCLLLAARLLAFEVAFDLCFYWAHRVAHAPALYSWVHKLHHAHTHDLELVSALQMGPLDVLLTHTVPLLAAARAVPLAPGLEFGLAKTYLLFQELYGHAGVAHRGRNFGPCPWLPELAGCELRAADHQRHHIKCDVNYSKRFALFDRLFGTWEPASFEPSSFAANPEAKTKKT